MARAKTIFNRVLRRWFPKRYINKLMKSSGEEFRQQLQEIRALGLPTLERQNREAELNAHADFWELREWLYSIEDKELTRRATKIGIDLDDIPFPEPEQFQRPGLRKMSSFGYEVLYDESRKAINKAVRERLPVYRKERREVVQFYWTLFIGAMGTIIALAAVLKK